MSRLLAVAAAVALGVTLAGCGSSSRPRLDPDVAGKPTWGDCQEIAGHSLDYVSGIHGERTVEGALAPYRHGGYHVVVELRPGYPRRWLLVDDSNHIHRALGISHTTSGWLVDSVDECAD